MEIPDSTREQIQILLVVNFYQTQIVENYQNSRSTLETSEHHMEIAVSRGTKKTTISSVTQQFYILKAKI